MKRSHRALYVVTCGIFARTCAGVAYAQQTYLAKPVHLIVPWPTGGVADFLARIVGQGLTDSWGKHRTGRTWRVLKTRSGTCAGRGTAREP